jgi:hydrogenase expression/formation protein HypE
MDKSADNSEFPSCGVPFNRPAQVLLAHGGGGRLMHQLIAGVFVKALGELGLVSDHDSAVLRVPVGQIAFTTDSYVVRPLFFPGGDIGKLAICGTVNDLAMSGARPAYISLGVILEEGFPVEQLEKIVQSIRAVAAECQVSVVTGDTKVVERGKGDGIYLNTSGIGIIEHGLSIHPKSARAGDAVLVSGDLGRHGIAIMAAREGLELETTIESDCAPLWVLVQALLRAGIEIRCLRDLTRGGLASALNEIATTAVREVLIDEGRVPVDLQVRGACEILGLDPLYVANEGRMLAVVPSSQAEQAIQILRQFPVGTQSCVIGQVTEKVGKDVLIKSRIGVVRNLDLLSGEQLPRIC